MKFNYIIEICVAIDIAILGIAYPIIVDKISNIGEKYNSNYLSELFNDEFPQKKINKKLDISSFKFTLYLTIFLFLFLILSLPPLFKTNIELIDFLIGNSAEILIFISTLALTIQFFIWLDKIMLFNGKATTLLNRVIKKYNQFENDENILKKYHLKTVSELAFYALNKPDKHLQKTLLEFYYGEFSTIRRKHNKTNPLEYPNELYEFIYDLNSIVVQQENVKLPALEHRAVSGIWLLGEGFDEIEISEKTYNWLWRNLVLICKNEKFVKTYWSTAHQYISYRLNHIQQDYDFESGTIINEAEVLKRENERKIFLEFHYALGGLLTYTNQFKTIKYILQFSQSLPPSYPLLPETMNEIFQRFEDFRNEFKRATPVDIKYYFPELDNLGNSGQITFWIGNYIALLFIRQFSRNEIYTYQNFTAQPQLPDDILELNNWYDGLTFFESCLKNVLSNKELLKETNYLEIAELKENEFFDFIIELRKNIKDKIGIEKLNAPISTEKVNTFNERTKEIINSAFKEYQKIFIPLDKSIESSDLKLTVNGITTLFSKSAFTDKDIPNLNFDTVLASQIANGIIKKYIPNSFLISRTRRYLLNIDNIIDGIEKLQFDKEKFVIIGVNLNSNLTNKLSDYESVLIKIPSTQHTIQNTLFILEKDKLPSIIHKDLKKEEIDEKKLKEIDENIKLYTSVIELENSELKEKWSEIMNPRDIEVNVRVTIAFLSLIIWKKDVEVVQLNIENQFKEQGIPNKISEIIPLKKPAGNNV